MLKGAAAGGRSAASGSFVAAVAGLLAALAVAWFAIDRQSFWMDELGTWQYAGAPGLKGWVRIFLNIGNSDGQLPLYHFLIFLWSRVAGLTEIGLRSLNGAMLALAIGAIGWSGAPLRGVAWRWALLLLLNCFVWAYLNEARPYVMLLAGATLLTVALARAEGARLAGQPAPMGPVMMSFFTGALLSFGASPIAAPFIAAMALAVLWSVGVRGLTAIGRIGLWRALWCFACVGVACGVAALVLYSMAKGATPELRNSTSLATTAFGVLEVMGGGGYVPGRDVLRTAGLHALQPAQWLGLVVLASAWGAAVLAALRGPQRRLAVMLLAIVAFSMLCAMAAGFAIGFRVVGRHFAFAVPPLMLVVAMGCGTRWRTVATFGFALLLIGSTLLFRSDMGHAKDDTRGAAAVMLAAHDKGRPSWWVGGYLIPKYFGFPTKPFAAAGLPCNCALMAAPKEDWKASIDRLPVPDAIVVERPEVNDPAGLFARYAEARGLSKRQVLRGYVAYVRP